MTTQIPDHIRLAAHEAAAFPLGQAFTMSPYELVDLALNAVYPLIAAAERERIREIAEVRKGDLVLRGLLVDSLPWTMLIGILDDIQREAGDHDAR